MTDNQSITVSIAEAAKIVGISESLARRLEWHEAMTQEVERLNAENERLRAENSSRRKESDVLASAHNAMLLELRDAHAENAELKRVLALVSKTGRADNEENERLRIGLDMVAEERDAWRARALGLPQEPCRHADHPSVPTQDVADDEQHAQHDSHGDRYL